MKAFKGLLIALLYVLYAPFISIFAVLTMVILPINAVCRSIETIIEFLDD